jgi:hypothetical protein
VRQIAVPPDARALGTLPRIDYEDAFLVDTGPVSERTPEQWARAVLEDAPLKLRTALLSGWSALGLNLARPGSEGSVLGWPIRVSTEDVLLLGAESHIGMPAELLLRREPGGFLFSTFVHHGNPGARAIWAGVEPVHVPIVRRILERASGRAG